MTERPNALLGVLVSAAGAVAGLIIGSLAAMGGAGLASLAATMLGVLSACLFFLTELEQIPLAAAALLMGIVIASGSAFLRTCLGYLREQKSLAALPLERIEGGPLREIAGSAGVQELCLVPASRPAAFCYGLLRPRLVVTTGLLERLTPAEQAAVVWHEAHHAREREPLKCLIGRSTVRTLFWLPTLRDLLDRYLLVKELAADRVAAERTSKSALAGALSEVLRETSPAGAVGLAEFAAARVDRLFDPTAALPPLFRPRRLILSIAALAGLIVLAALANVVGSWATPSAESMLGSMSLHGLPGMLTGLAANAFLVAGALVIGRRLRLRHMRTADCD